MAGRETQRSVTGPCRRSRRRDLYPLACLQEARIVSFTLHQDYRKLTLDQHELLEKQTLRMIVQALQQYSREAKDIFETTHATSKTEVIVLAEDLTQYALEVAEVYAINKRFAGFIDYKRARWFPTPYGLIPQVLLVDAKASTESNRETLQRSQLPMNAEFVTTQGTIVRLDAGVPEHTEIASHAGAPLLAVTTSIFVHFYYQDVENVQRYRDFKDIFVLSSRDKTPAQDAAT